MALRTLGASGTAIALIAAEEGSPVDSSNRGELEFAAYSVITLAREGLLFPGLPSARAPLKGKEQP